MGLAVKHGPVMEVLFFSEVADETNELWRRGQTNQLLSAVEERFSIMG